MSMEKNIMTVVGYATLIKAICIRIYSCFIADSSWFNGPEIKRDTIPFVSIADWIAF